MFLSGGKTLVEMLTMLQAGYDMDSGLDGMVKCATRGCPVMMSCCTECFLANISIVRKAA